MGYSSSSHGLFQQSSGTTSAAALDHTAGDQAGLNAEDEDDLALVREDSGDASPAAADKAKMQSSLDATLTSKEEIGGDENTSREPVLVSDMKIRELLDGSRMQTTQPSESVACPQALQWHPHSGVVKRSHARLLAHIDSDGLMHEADGKSPDKVTPAEPCFPANPLSVLRPLEVPSALHVHGQETPPRRGRQENNGGGSQSDIAKAKEAIRRFQEKRTRFSALKGEPASVSPCLLQSADVDQAHDKKEWQEGGVAGEPRKEIANAGEGAGAVQKKRSADATVVLVDGFR